MYHVEDNHNQYPQDRSVPFNNCLDFSFNLKKA